MLLVDERTGSKELLQGIRNLGVDAEIGGKLAADFQWQGNGPKGEILCGVERKTIQDLANSIRGKRFEGQQLQPMLDTYEVRYMVVEGLWRRSKEDGVIEILERGMWQHLKGSMKYGEADKFCVWLEEMYGFRVWRTTNTTETTAYLVNRYQWWQKPWKKHHAAGVYAPAPEIKRNGHKAMIRRDPTLLEKWAAQLPGVDDRAIEIAARFSSPLELANAGVAEWLEQCKGLRMGRLSARKIVDAVRGDKWKP